MKAKSGTSRQEMLCDAANHLQSALDLLDGAEAPAHIGARVDLAAHQLREAIADYLASPVALN